MFKEAKIRAQQKKADATPAVEVQPSVVAPVIEAPAPTVEIFVPDGQILPDGSVRYKILCDGGINPSGVFWSKIVPPGASKDVYLEAQAERDNALKDLRGLTGN